MSYLCFVALLGGCNASQDKVNVHVDYKVLKNCFGSICRLELVKEEYNSVENGVKKNIKLEHIDPTKHNLLWRLPRGRFISANDRELLPYFNINIDNNVNSNPVLYKFMDNNIKHKFNVSFELGKNSIKLRDSVEFLKNSRSSFLFKGKHYSLNELLTGLSPYSKILWKKKNDVLTFVCPNGYVIPSAVKKIIKGEELSYIRSVAVLNRYIVLDKDNRVVNDGIINSAIYSVGDSIDWNHGDRVIEFACVPYKYRNDYKFDPNQSKKVNYLS